LSEDQLEQLVFAVGGGDYLMMTFQYRRDRHDAEDTDPVEKIGREPSGLLPDAQDTSSWSLKSLR
jgi:hypothetical protein